MNENKFNNCMIELCEMPEAELAGRVKIRMSALAICPNSTVYNENGISWDETAVINNIESLKSASYKVCFIDEDKTIPSGHGDLEYDDQGNVIFSDKRCGRFNFRCSY